MRRVVVLLLLFCFFTGAQAEVEDWEQFYLQLEKAYGGSISAEEFKEFLMPAPTTSPEEVLAGLERQGETGTILQALYAADWVSGWMTLEENVEELQKLGFEFEIEKGNAPGDKGYFEFMGKSYTTLCRQFCLSFSQNIRLYLRTEPESILLKELPNGSMTPVEEPTNEMTNSMELVVENTEMFSYLNVEMIPS